MSKQLKISNLEVESFVTSMNEDKIKGGVQFTEWCTQGEKACQYTNPNSACETQAPFC